MLEKKPTRRTRSGHTQGSWERREREREREGERGGGGRKRKRFRYWCFAASLFLSHFLFLSPRRMKRPDQERWESHGETTARRRWWKVGRRSRRFWGNLNRFAAENDQRISRWNDDARRRLTFLFVAVLWSDVTPFLFLSLSYPLLSLALLFFASISSFIYLLLLSFLLFLLLLLFSYTVSRSSSSMSAAVRNYLFVMTATLSSSSARTANPVHHLDCVRIKFKYSMIPCRPDPHYSPQQRRSIHSRARLIRKTNLIVLSAISCMCKNRLGAAHLTTGIRTS